MLLRFAAQTDVQMSLYLASPSCPAFLPLLHGLVTASLLPEPGNGIEAMSTRMTCAMALVRFVNGMVDPLQTGACTACVALAGPLTYRRVCAPDISPGRHYQPPAVTHRRATPSDPRRPAASAASSHVDPPRH
jgi:ribosomal biogenesis protein LAS1